MIKNGTGHIASGRGDLWNLLEEADGEEEYVGILAKLFIKKLW